MLSIDKKMAGVEEVEFSVTETIENKLEIVLRADQNIEASIQAGIAAGTKEVSFIKSIFFLLIQDWINKRAHGVRGPGPF